MRPAGGELAMCGINGVFSLDGAPLDGCVVERHRAIREGMAYRGPDRRSEFVSDLVFLGVSQFNITGIENNVQPAVSEDGCRAVILNGEIYNYRSLNEEFARRGRRIRSACDHETLVHLFEEEGERGLALVQGMFAVAMYDAAARTLVLGRDRFGEKPLFYLIQDNRLHFASEANFLVPMTRRQIDDDQLIRYLAFGFSSDHLVQGIRRVRPGTVLVADRTGVRTERFWKARFFIDTTLTPERASRRAREILRESVAEMTPREVAFGNYVSGGIDSAIIASLFSRGRGGAPLFTSGIVGLVSNAVGIPVDDDYAYVERKENEVEYADVLAAHLGAPYHRVCFTVGQLASVLPEMVQHLPGGPVVSTSFPLFYFTAGESRGARVCFTGEGSDELHGGYATSQPERYGASLARSFYRASRYFQPDELKVMLGESRWSRLDEICDGIDEHVDAEAEIDSPPDEELFHKIRFFMFEHVFANHLLEKADGMTMGNAPTELRMPFLSTGYSNFALTLPLSVCRRGTERKAICSDVAELLGVPSVIVQRSGKQRTSLPYYRLFYREPEFKQFVARYLHRRSRLRNLLNLQDPGAFVAGLEGRQDAHKRAWALLVLEIWLERNFD